MKFSLRRRYLVFDIGCIECCEPSGIVGIYRTRDKAYAACNEAADRQAADWQGQHRFHVYDLADRGDYSDYTPLKGSK